MDGFIGSVSVIVSSHSGSKVSEEAAAALVRAGPIMQNNEAAALRVLMGTYFAFLIAISNEIGTSSVIGSEYMIGITVETQQKLARSERS